MCVLSVSATVASVSAVWDYSIATQLLIVTDKFLFFFNLCLPGLKKLDDSLISEINEYFLLHGTKPSVVDVIEKQGLDFRLNSRGMLGKAVYFGESSTKADQYAGNKRLTGTNYSVPESGPVSYWAT